jgi:hypothetical protein
MLHPCTADIHISKYCSGLRQQHARKACRHCVANAMGVFGFFLVPMFGYRAVCFDHPQLVAADIVQIPVSFFVSKNKNEKQSKKY